MTANASEISFGRWVMWSTPVATWNRRHAGHPVKHQASSLLGPLLIGLFILRMWFYFISMVGKLEFFSEKITFTVPRLIVNLCSQETEK